MKFQKGSGDNELSYPLTKEAVENLKPCQLVSPREGKRHGYNLPENIDFKEHCDEITEVGAMVEKNEMPEAFLDKYWPHESKRPHGIPEFLKEAGYDTPKKIRDLVRNDPPHMVAEMCFKWLYSKGYRLKAQDKRFNDFVKGLPLFMSVLTPAIQKGLEKAFDIKCYFGVPRYEEVFEDIYGEKPEMPWEEGAPCHASTPAGHSKVFFVSVKVLLEMFEKLPNEIELEIRQAFNLVSHARSFAKVHWGFDNVFFEDPKNRVNIF